MTEVREFREAQLDGLREVANIGAGHAATALSEMTGSRIMISVPRLQIVPLEETSELLGDGGQVVAAVLMNMLGDLTGRTLLVFPRDSAMRVSEILLRRAPGSSQRFGELEQSAIKEVGNILAAAYMNALAQFMEMMLLPSVPSLVVDLCGAVLTTTYTGAGEELDCVVSVETQFTMSGNEDAVHAHFLLLPDPGSLQMILRAIRLD